MKKILFFIPTLTGGGAEKVLVNLVNNMDRTKFDITVETLFDVGTNRQYLDKNIKYKYVFKRLFKGNVTLLKLFKPEFLYKHMIKERYDIVVSYLQSPTMRIVTGCPDRSVKLISWIHNEFHNSKALARMYRNTSEFNASIDRYDRLVFVARSAEDALAEAMPEIKDKSVTIYNTVESDEIRKKAEEPLEIEYPKDKINLVSTGRFAPQKAFDRLIRIISVLKKEGLPVHLSILGDGALRADYEKLIGELGLNDDVTLLGYRENPYKYVKQADLFVCSSTHEGFSTAVTEALIVGTPVITTLCSGMEELLGSNGEYGIITENSEEALLNGLRELLKSGSLGELKEKAAERGSFFDKENTVAETERFFLEV